MDWSLISFHQGIDDNTDPSVAVIQVNYLGDPICFQTTVMVPIAHVQDSGPWTADLQAAADNVIECCPATIETMNPNYDSSLTACW